MKKTAPTIPALESIQALLAQRERAFTELAEVSASIPECTAELVRLETEANILSDEVIDRIGFLTARLRGAKLRADRHQAFITQSNRQLWQKVDSFHRGTTAQFFHVSINRAAEVMTKTLKPYFGDADNLNAAVFRTSAVQDMHAAFTRNVCAAVPGEFGTDRDYDRYAERFLEVWAELQELAAKIAG